MADLKGTQTEKNLWTAFAGESQARNKYDYFASAAKKAGFEQIAAIFTETALNEKEHAKLWFKALGGMSDSSNAWADSSSRGDTSDEVATSCSRSSGYWSASGGGGGK